MRLRSFLSASIVAIVVTLAGCARTVPQNTPPSVHAHHAPHNGTAVVLGEEIYHLELVLDASAGKLGAFVLDGEMENYIRISAPGFEIVATIGGQRAILNFTAVSDPATGETVGDTSFFEARAEWLKTISTFDAVLTRLDVRGTAFSNVAFNFPKGNDPDQSRPAPGSHTPGLEGK